jgi:hypothetical protein
VVAFAEEPLVVPAPRVPPGGALTFKVGTRTVQLPVTFARDNWAFLAAFAPAATVPPGTYAATLPGPAGPTAIELRVQPKASRHRVLLPALQKPRRPYSILVLANPRFELPDLTRIADPLMANRARFHASLRYILDDLLNRGEELLALRDAKGLLQVETLYDPALAADPANSFVYARSPNAWGDERFALVATQPLRSFLQREGLAPDVVYVVHDVAAHPRPTAVPGIDDLTGPKRTLLVDGKPRVIGAFARSPGAVALSAGADQSLPTAMHEFGHAASDASSGWVMDLYDDKPPGSTTINKKRRPPGTTALPATFGVCDGESFTTAPDRWPGKGYGTWLSYHPSRVEAGQPNLMDNYGAAADKRRCRFDRLTLKWLGARLDFKMAR